MIHVNGEPSTLAAGCSVGELLRALGAPDRGVAVAVDAEIVPRGEWDAVTVPDGAHVEVLTAVQGG
jgi:sulfur carrier protein